jgi:hypothetical protein
MTSPTTLKVGDRVAVYDDGKRMVGKVGQMCDSSGNQNIRVDNVKSQQCATWSFGWFHRKQLRKLKRKRRRRVWIAASTLKLNLEAVPAWKFPSIGSLEEYIEFEEVRKPKAVKP